MCFSAEASFGASAVLSVVGVMAIKKTTSASQRLFAAIPLIFAVQQLTEGVVWLSLTNPDFGSWEYPSVHCFLFFAEVLWPIWAPFAICQLEQDPARRKHLLALALAGLLVSLYLACHLVFYPAAADIAGHHIHYSQDFPISRLWFSGIFYVIPTVLPFFISTVKNMWTMGITLLASYFVTHLFYAEYVTSVWCFFAAILSAEVLFLIIEARKDHGNAARVTARTNPGT